MDKSSSWLIPESPGLLFEPQTKREQGEKRRGRGRRGWGGDRRALCRTNNGKLYANKNWGGLFTLVFFQSDRRPRARERARVTVWNSIFRKGTACGSNGESTGCSSILCSHRTWGFFSKEEIGFEVNRVDSSHIFLKIEEVLWPIFISKKSPFCQ